jgi:MFS family permease
MPITAFIKKLFPINKFTLEESKAIYATNTLAGLAQALLGIFIPIYIYNLSLDYPVFSNVEEINGFIWAISYYATFSLTAVVSALVFGELIFEWTLKKTIFFSKIFLIASLASLSLSTHSIYLILLAGIFRGIHTNFYWIPYHIFFVKRVDDGDEKYGSETGKRDFLLGVATSIGPLLGSLIIAQFGFTMLYGFAIVLLFLATLPIILYVEERTHRKHSMKDVYFNFIKNKKYFTTTVALGGSLVSNLVYVLFWSLMLYFGLKSFVEIGILTTFSGILALALMLVVGKIIDKNSKVSIHTFGVIGNTLLHWTRLFFGSTGFLYINGILDNVNAPFYNIPFNATIYERSLEGSVSDFLVYREIAMHAGRLIVLIFIAVLLLATNSWVWVFFLGGVASAATILVNF